MVDLHGLRYTDVYTATIDPPLQSDSGVHLRIMPRSATTQYEDYKILLPNATGSTTTKLLQLAAGASRASFKMSFVAGYEADGAEDVFLELAAVEDAPFAVRDDYLSDERQDVEISVFDNSCPIPLGADPERGIDIQPGAAATEPKATVSYTVVLTSSPASLTFTSSNRSAPPTFTVTPGSDALGETYLELHGLEGDGEDYDTHYSLKGPGIDGQTHITKSVAAGGL